MSGTTLGRVHTRLAAALVTLCIVAGGLAIPAEPAAASTNVTITYSYTGSTQTFTVPAGVTSIVVTIKGGQGGLGGGDSQGSPIPGGYQGVVTGTIAVTPGAVLTIATGGGGGTGNSSQSSAPGGFAGQNPLAGYDGAVGGVAGPEGSSGGGGGSGAASVLRIGATDIVAGGAGGNGGNGQFYPIVGRRAAETHLARPDATSTTGRPGVNTATMCSQGFRCDGGASGAGGGGAQGGDQGVVQYGGDTATEYFGFGGYPGANSTAGLVGLTETYDFYPANNANGSITIIYDDGAPGAPQGLAGSTQTNAVALEWDAPASSGSSAITDYRVESATSVNGPFTIFPDGVSTALAATVTGLTNGTTYYFRVSAINSEGVGAPATTSIGIVPSSVPAPPTVTSLDPFGSGINVNFTPGTSHSPITGYEYRLDAGEWSSGSVAGNQLTISGLVNGQTYSVEIRARNIIGASAASAPAQTGTPRDVAQAPTALLAVAGNGSVAADWNPPTVVNGAPVTDYIIQTATSLGGTYTTFLDGTSTASSATVTGLVNGTTYYLRVAAVNAVGAGAWSTPAVATPFTSPDAPSIVLTPGDGMITVAITPGFDGGSAVTAYEYRLGAEGTWKSTGSLAASVVVAGLVNGTEYDGYIRSVNAAGPSAPSVVASATPRTVPSAPAISAVALDTGAVSVSFSVGSDGGSPLTNVEYSIDLGDTWVTRNPESSTSPLTIGGLTGGVTYPIAVRVVNAAGFSAPSNTSMVTAKGTPEAPVITVAPADRTLIVSFTTPANGGVPITNYEFSVDGGVTWEPRSPAATSTPLVIDGLDNDTTSLVNGAIYGVRLRAVNTVGAGPSSNQVDVAPRTTPGAPSIVGDTIVGVDGNLDVDFTAPSSNGGSPITMYQYSTDGGVTWADRQNGTTGSPLRITAASSTSVNGSPPLTGGVEYPVEIRAVNAAGPGVASATAAGITTTEPAIPEIVSSEPRNASASIHFMPPANGGSPIIRYEYSLDFGDSWIDTGSLADVFIVNDLVNSGTYDLVLRAVNDVGPGLQSEGWLIEVFTTPDAPGLDEITAGDGNLAVAFSGAGDGGSEITGYEYSTDGGSTWRPRTSGATESPLLVTEESIPDGQSLANGTIYAVQLRAVNAAGAGAASETKLAAPRGVPFILGNVEATPADGALVITFTPNFDGGSPITAIEYQLDGGDWFDTGSLSSPLTIGELVNGQSYSVSLRARNAVGPGDHSDPTSQTTPRSVPDAPTGLVLTSTSHQVTATWIAPGFDGGAEVIGYTVSLYTQASGGTPIRTCPTDGALTCTVTGLTNGTTVYAEVAAENDAGSGQASSPRQVQTPLGVPAVAIASIAPGSTELAITVNVIDGGGSPITAFEYELDGDEWQTASAVSSPFTISGLTTGHLYSIRIRATTAAGTGNPSSPVTAIPHTTPSTPTSLAATSAPASAVLSWNAPASTGGQPISDYVVQFAASSDGPFTTFNDGTSSATAATVTGLNNGSSYVFRVAGLNTAGTGPWSTLASATPRSAPSAPVITTITPGSRYLQVAFTAPSSNGGSAITGYEYQLDGGAWLSASASSSPLTINGLNNGQTYAVQIRAVNAIGGGNASTAVNAKPYGLPSAVVGFRASPTANSVVLSWDAVNDNGSAITAYNVIRWSAATEGSIAASNSTTATTTTFAGLGNGTYYFTIEAINAAGVGPRSAPRTTAMVGSTVPSAPSSIAASITATADGADATMSWTPGAAGTTAITSYLVQYSTDDSTWVTTASGSSAAAATFDISSATTPYSLRVAAISAVGVGEFTAVRPPLAATGAATNVGLTGADIAASANANGGGTGSVVVEVATAAAPGAVVATVSATPATVTGSGSTSVSAGVTGLQPGTTYLARSVVTNGTLVARGRTTPFTTGATIVSSNLNPVYAGSPVVMTTVTSPEGLALTRSFVGINGTVYPTTATPPTNVGTYSVTTTAADPAISGTEVVSLTIVPKALTVTVSGVDREYDGMTSLALTVGLVGVVLGDDVQLDASRISGAFDDASAGIAKAVHLTTTPGLLTGADLPNYTPSVPTEATATIEPMAQTLTFTSPAPSAAVVGTTYVPIVVSNASLTPELAIETGFGGICSVSNGTVTMLSAGLCVVVAMQSGTNNVAEAVPVQQTFTVSSLPSAPTAISATIDDTAATLTWTAGAAGSAPIDNYVVQYSTDGDTWDVVSTGSTATSAAFELPSATTPYAVRVAAVTAVGVGPFTTVRPPIVDTGSISNVGPFGATLTGSVDANAHGSAGHVSFEVATTIDDLGTANATTFEATPETVTGSGATAAAAAATNLAPGTEFVARAVVINDGFVVRGLTKSFTTHASIVSSNLSPVYTGSPIVMSAVTSPVELALSRTFVGVGATVYPSSSTPPTDVGTYTMTTFPSGHVLGGEEIVGVTIVPKPITVTVDAADRDFDGTTAAALTLGLDGVVDGDDVQVDEADVSGAFEDADAGIDKTVHITAGDDLLAGLDIANYAPTIAATVTATITRATQTLTFTSTAPSSAVVRGSYVAAVVSSASLTPTLSVDGTSSTVCSILNGTVAFVAAGSCVVVASQEGTINYAAADSVQQTFTIAPEVAPAAPSHVSTIITDLDATMTWTAGEPGTSPITGFLVQYSSDGDIWEEMSSGSVSTSAAFELPSASMPYALRVAGVSDAGIGAFATVRPPIAVTGSVTNVGVASASIGGSANANAGGGTTMVSFEIASTVGELGTEGATTFVASPDSVSGSDATAVDATLTDLEPNTSYVVRVVVTADGHVVRGATRALTTDASIISSNLSRVYTGSPVVMSTETVPVDLALSRTFEGIDGTVYPSSSTAPTAAGAYRVTTTPASHAIGGEEVVTLTITQAPQTISFTSAAPTGALVGETYVPVVVSSAALTSTVIVEPDAAGVCSVDSGTVTFLAAGWCMLVANQQGTNDFSAAQPVEQAFNVDPVVLPSAPTDITVEIDDDHAAMAWIAGAAGTSAIDEYVVQYSTDGTSWVTMSSGSVATSATFDLPSTSAPYALRVAAVSAAGVGAFATVRPPVVSSGAPTSIGPFGATVGGSADANGGGAADVTFELATSPASLGTGSSIHVVADPASVSGSGATAISGSFGDLQPLTSYVVRARVAADGIVVHGAIANFTTDASIVSSGPSLSPVYTGSPVVVTSVTQPADLGVERTYVGIAGTVYPSTATPPTNAGTYSVTTRPADHAIGGSETVTLTVRRGAQSLSFTSSPPPSATVGETYVPVLESSAGLVPALAVAPDAAAVCSVSAGTVTMLSAGECVLVATHPGAANFVAAAAVEQRFAVVAAPVPAPIVPAPIIEAKLDLTLTIETGEAVADATVIVTGDGLKPRSEVRIELHSTPILLGTATTDATGSFTTTVQLPASVPAGTHHVVAIGVGPDDLPVTEREEIFVDWAGVFEEILTSGGYTSSTATRILDTRESGIRLTAATEHRLGIPAGLLPTDVTAVALNLTVTDPARAGYITVYPCGTPHPLSSAINFAAGETKANLVDAMLRSDGALCLWSSVDTDAVVDVQGFHSDSSTGRLVPRTATRVLDTRLGSALVGEQVVRIPVVGQGKAPVGTTTVVLNVAVDDPELAGFITLYPCGTPRPWTSNLNFVAGQTVSNEVLVQPGDAGEVCAYTTRATQLIVDLDASFDSAGDGVFTPMVSGRFSDTRLTTKVNAGETVAWSVVGTDSAPVGTTALSLNVAVTDPDGPGYLTVYPCGVDRPWASNLNFTTGQTISNHVTATVGDGGKICVFANHSTNVVVDIEGAYRPA